MIKALFSMALEKTIHRDRPSSEEERLNEVFNNKARLRDELYARIPKERPYSVYELEALKNKTGADYKAVWIFEEVVKQKLIEKGWSQLVLGEFGVTISQDRATAHNNMVTALSILETQAVGCSSLNIRMILKDYLKESHRLHGAAAFILEHVQDIEDVVEELKNFKERDIENYNCIHLVPRQMH